MKNQSNLLNSILSDKNNEAFLQFLDDFKKEVTNDVYHYFANQFKLQKLYYTYKEVSVVTGISVNTLRQRKKNGTLKVAYFESKALIPKKEVEKILDRLNRQVR